LEEIKMSNNKSSSSSGTSATGLFLGLASMGAGAYHGYCDANGILFEKENMEWALTYGPTIVRGAIGAIGGGVAGLVGGGVIGAASSNYKDSALEKIAKGSGGAVVGTAAGATVGGTIGAAIGAVQTVVGYGIGYIAGYILK
jgi:hypothetical protein